MDAPGEWYKVRAFSFLMLYSSAAYRTHAVITCWHRHVPIETRTLSIRRGEIRKRIRV